MYRRDVAVGSSITFVGPSSEWIRIDVLSIADDRVQIGVAWPEAYPPRGNEYRVRLGRFRVRVLKLVGAGRVQLGIDMPAGFHSIAREALPFVEAPTEPPAPTVPQEKRAVDAAPATKQRATNGHTRKRSLPRRRRRGRHRGDGHEEGTGAAHSTAAENAVAAASRPISKGALTRLLSRNSSRLR
jgi:hypothetical protein